MKGMLAADWVAMLTRYLYTPDVYIHAGITPAVVREAKLALTRRKSGRFVGDALKCGGGLQRVQYLTISWPKIEWALATLLPRNQCGLYLAVDHFMEKVARVYCRYFGEKQSACSC